MKACAIVDKFGIDELKFVSRNDPRPGDGEVLVKIKAVSLNFRDLLVIEGSRKVKLPLIPASDAAGEVVALGDNVTCLRVGDRVMPTFVRGWATGEHPPIDELQTLGGPLDGVLAEMGVWRESDLVRIPEYLPDTEAACLPCAAVSAWNALLVAGHVKPGDVVLVQGTGGVSLFALQFAKLAGARTIVVSSSNEKLDRVRTLGADICINYIDDPNWGASAKALTTHGVDYVVDVGGATTFPQSLAAVRNAGQICSIGALSGAVGLSNFAQFGMKSVKIVGIRVGNRESFESMLRAITQHRMRPVVDSTFSFLHTRSALARLAAGQHFGKITISM